MLSPLLPLSVKRRLFPQCAGLAGPTDASSHDACDAAAELVYLTASSTGATTTIVTASEIENSKIEVVSSPLWFSPQESSSFDSRTLRSAASSNKVSASAVNVVESSQDYESFVDVLHRLLPLQLRLHSRFRHHLRRVMPCLWHGRRGCCLTYLCRSGRRCARRMSCLLLFLIVLLVLALLLLLLSLAVLRWKGEGAPFDVPPPFPLPINLDDLSVVVSHELSSVAASLSAVPSETRKPNNKKDVDDERRENVVMTANGADVISPSVALVGLLELPPWTLHIVDKSCADCLDRYTYESAVATINKKVATSAAAALSKRVQTHIGEAVAIVTTLVPPNSSSTLRGQNREVCYSRASVKGTAKADEQEKVVLGSGGVHASFSGLNGNYAVFATSAAPLGRIGPMLLAMVSVTNDVDVVRELPQWTWVGETFHKATTTTDFVLPRRHKRLAVLGIPSTDQPSRHALREAQRATWFTYGNIGRVSNHFDGAVLPLYIFAASEDAIDATAVSQSGKGVATAAVDATIETEHKHRVSLKGNRPREVDNAVRDALYVEAVRGESLNTEGPMVAELLPLREELQRASLFHLKHSRADDKTSGTDREHVGTPAAGALQPTPSNCSGCDTEVPLPQEFPSYPRRVFHLKEHVRNAIGDSYSFKDNSITAASPPLKRIEPLAGPTYRTDPSTAFSQRSHNEGHSKITNNKNDESGATNQDRMMHHYGVCGDVLSTVVSRLPSQKAGTFAAASAAITTVADLSKEMISPLTWLAQALQLPVTPAFVAPARHICKASAELWQEALTHRNMVWVDMVTDRHPTTNKTLGGVGDWGMPAEVGMTQKSVLWFYYAFHAFPTVPYIMKGDDDTYVKVPQFLSDLHMLRTGHREPELEACAPPPFHTSPSRSFVVNTREHINRTMVRGIDGIRHTFGIAEPSLEDEECMYWGATRIFLDRIAFNAGPLYLLQRRLVQTALETLPDRDPNRDVLRLASDNYNPARRPWYKYNVMQNEDAMFGKLMKERGERSKQLCPRQRWWIMREVSKRFHDIHRGKTEVVSWATVVVHRCTPADYYYLHRYFATEFLAAAGGTRLRCASTVSSLTTGQRAKDAQIAAAQWAKTHLQEKNVIGWQHLPRVSWQYNPVTDPPFTLSKADGVALYDMPYEAWDEVLTSVVTGGTSRLRMVKGFIASLLGM